MKIKEFNKMKNMKIEEFKKINMKKKKNLKMH